MSRTNFEQLRVYQLAEQLADEIWTITTQWDRRAQYTVGEQLIQACDSIGANIAGGVGRGSFQDNRRFVRIARGSLNETKHWLRRAYRRNLLASEHVEKLKPIIDALSPMLNAYLKSIGRKKDDSEENNYHSECVDETSHPTDYELLTTNKT